MADVSVALAAGGSRAKLRALLSVGAPSPSPLLPDAAGRAPMSCTTRVRSAVAGDDKIDNQAGDDRRNNAASDDEK